MPEFFVRSEIEKSVARITLDRAARRNALTKAMLEQMTRLVREAAENDEVRIIVVAAEGPVFCAGMDLGEMQQRAEQQRSHKEWLADSQVYHDLLVALLDAPQPTLAVVQGPAVAGGVGIVLACDLVLAAENAYFWLPEPQRGITASIVTPLLVYRAGAGAASHMLLAGTRVSATDMHHWGVCHQVVPSEALQSTAAESIRSILSGSPQALAATKGQIRQASGNHLADQLRQAVEQSATARGTDDAREGLQAFLEKRKSRWAED